MVNLAKIRHLLLLHKKWLAGEEGGKRLNLQGEDLRGVDLTDENLRYALLQEADFTDAILLRADLRGANANRADFTSACLDESHLDTGIKGSVFDDATFENAHIEDGMDFARDAASLDSASFHGTKRYRRGQGEPGFHETEEPTLVEHGGVQHMGGSLRSHDHDDFVEPVRPHLGESGRSNGLRRR